MIAKGILKGLGVTIKHFFATYLDDFRWRGKRYFTEDGLTYRASSDVQGIFTVQYPEEKLRVPEEFRYIPILLYEDGENGEKNIRCTACGICAKVCPPQCIWIVRGKNPKTGRPMASPEEFYIDIDICMNCGFCTEFCPFDSIKMDHDYEIASYDRKSNHILNLEKLLRSVAYYAKIRPRNYLTENEYKKIKHSD